MFSNTSRSAVQIFKRFLFFILQFHLLNIFTEPFHLKEMNNFESEVILESSTDEVECFLDPDNEIFFGPITEREREIRKSLPRRTLHPK